MMTKPLILPDSLCGSTTWSLNMHRRHPERTYNKEAFLTIPDGSEIPVLSLLQNTLILRAQVSLASELM
jgi:hypothetical protein